MTIQLNEDYMMNFLNQLLNTPSPSGYTHHVMELIRKEAESLGVPIEWNAKGGAILNLEGQETDRTVALSAHVDTLGAMVRSITAQGTLRLTSVGGFMMNSIENEYCLIHTRSGQTYTGTILSSHPSVHVYDDARSFERKESHMEVRIDELVESKEDVFPARYCGGRFYFVRCASSRNTEWIYQVTASG